MKKIYLEYTGCEKLPERLYMHFLNTNYKTDLGLSILLRITDELKLIK